MDFFALSMSQRLVRHTNNWRAFTAGSQISASLHDMELDEIFCPDCSDLPPPTPDFDDALEM